MEVTNHTNFSINPIDKEKAGKVLQEVIPKLPRYWVSAGTALGLYRDKDFITGDTDIDVEMLEDVELDYPLIRTVTHEGKIQQRAYLINDTIFDIYFYQKEGDEYVNYNEQGVMRFPCYYFDTLEIIETKYGTLPFPSPVEDYLKYRYGDWQTPSNKKGLYGNDF